MALDALRKSDFWKKKFHTAVTATDVDKDGYISRTDFNMIVQRYKDAGSSPEHVKRLEESFEKLYEIWDMTDESKKLSLEEFEKMFEEKLEKSYAYTDELYSGWFRQVDMNADGVISLEEWKVHNAALGISSENAKKSFLAMDANGDNEVSLQEFIDYHTEFFFSAEDNLHSSILYGPLII